MREDLKSVKNLVKWSYLFALLVSELIKAARKMLMKWTPDVESTCQRGCRGCGVKKAIFIVSDTLDSPQKIWHFLMQ